MKTTLIMTIGFLGLAVTIGAVPVYSDEPAADHQRSYYLNCIENEIEDNVSKMEFVTSRSDNLREHGIEAAMKAAFLTKHRDALVQEMVLRNVGMRPHTVDHYLLLRFNEESHNLMVPKDD